MNYERELEELTLVIEGLIPKIEEERRYWLIRAGKESVFYKEFLNRKIIGIAWDLLNDKEELLNFNKEELEKKVLETYPEEKNIGNIVGKIMTFIHEVKKGDVVIMPSSGKEVISFGIIQDDDFFIDDTLENEESKKGLVKQSFGIPNKRRKVKWIKNLEKNAVNPRLLLNLFSPHSISEISEETIKNIIDSSMYSLYTKNNMGNLLFNVGVESDNRLKDIAEYINLLEDMSDFLSKKFGIENDISTKINLNSRGTTLIKGGVKVVICLALVVSALTGGEVSVFGQKFKFNGCLELYKEYNLEKQREFERKVQENRMLEDMKDTLKKINLK